MLTDERGVALMMALIVMFVLSIALGAVLTLSAESGRHGNSSNAGQKAYALAEAGLNDAVAQIASKYPNASTGSTSWLTHTAPAAAADGSTLDWSGSFDGSTKVWSLTGTGTVRNPTGGSAIARTVSAKVGVPPTAPLALAYQFYMHDPAAPCSEITNSGAASLSLFVASCLNLTGAARVVEPAAPGNTLDIYVGGILSIDNSSTMIGAASGGSPWPIRSATTPTGCKYSGGALTTCSAATKVWASTYSTATITGPAWHADAATIYAMANWSSSGVNPVTCSAGTNPFDNDNVRNSSLGTFRPLNGASFNCTARNGSGTVVGSLAWNSGTFALTVSGVVFIDASQLTFQNNDKALYSGSATVYVNGWVNFANSGSICGPGTGAAAVPLCPGEHWTPSSGQLLFWALNSAGVTPAFRLIGNSWFDGGAVADSQTATKAQFLSDNAGTIRGPAIGAYGALAGDGKAKSFPFTPAGAPPGDYTLGTPYEYGG